MAGKMKEAKHRLQEAKEMVKFWRRYLKSDEGQSREKWPGWKPGDKLSMKNNYEMGLSGLKHAIENEKKAKKKVGVRATAKGYKKGSGVRGPRGKMLYGAAAAAYKRKKMNPRARTSR